MINYLDYTYQTTKGEAQKDWIFNGALKGSFSDKDYTSAYVNGETYVATGTEVNNFVPLAWTPVDIRAINEYTKESIRPVVTVNGDIQTVGVPGETGTFDVVVSQTGLTFSSALTADDVVVTKYYFLNEEVRSDGYAAFGGPTNGNQAIDGATGAAGFTNVPEIGLKMQSVPVEAKARTLRAYWAFDAKLTV